MTSKRKTTKRAPRRASGRAQVTIHQVAEEAGVSTATVSRALNSPDKVRPETRERIADIIRRRHYVSDALAASLASRRSGTIGVIIPTIVYSIYAGFIHAIQKTCGSAGYTVLTGISEYSGSLEDEIVTRLLERRVDGLVLTGVDRDAAVYRKINSVGVPFVTTWNVSNDAKIPSVSFDNFDASMSAMAHLHGLGHRRIALVCGKSDRNDRAFERRRAYTEFLRDKRIRISAELIEERYFEFDEGEAAMRRILRCRRRPTAVFCANDILAVGAMHACRDLGLEIPGDISIMGFDDHPITEHVTPPLSTVRVPAERMGQCATEALMHSIATAEAPASRVLPTELVVRGSTAPPRHPPG